MLDARREQLSESVGLERAIPDRVPGIMVRLRWAFLSADGALDGLAAQGAESCQERDATDSAQSKRRRALQQ